MVYIKKKMRTRLLLLGVVVLIFLYWRGVKSVSEEKGWNCQYHLAYAVCDAKNNKAQLPGIWEIIKVGARF